MILKWKNEQDHKITLQTQVLVSLYLKQLITIIKKKKKDHSCLSRTLGHYLNSSGLILLYNKENKQTQQLKNDQLPITAKQQQS